jgi:sulfide:quinone oxidoreductase
MPPRHVLILGAGFAGLELATRLSEIAPDTTRVTLIDRNDAFFFGFSKLEVMLGRQSADEVKIPYNRIAKANVTFRQETVTAIDPQTRTVTTDASTYDDVDELVIAMGADYDLDATPGLAEGGHEYYTLAGAERLRDALADFAGGRVLLSVLGQPFKCPPAPFEGSFMLDNLFQERGTRGDVQLITTFPMRGPVPVTGEVSQMFKDGLAARDVEVHPETLVTHIDPTNNVAHTKDGREIPYDLFIAVPIHRAPEPLAASGLAPNGWIPVDQANLHTEFANVYALGDVCSGPRTVPKAGIFAESAALVVADDIVATIEGTEPPAPYSASGVCYAEFGGGLVGKVEVSFLRGDAPEAQRHEPALEFLEEKREFGATRVARWFS